MRIEIKEVVEVIELNKGRLKGITNGVEPDSTPGKELYRLINCFMGDLYKLFGDECLREAEERMSLKRFLRYRYNHEKY